MYNFFLKLHFKSYLVETAGSLIGTFPYTVLNSPGKLTHLSRFLRFIRHWALFLLFCGPLTGFRSSNYKINIVVVWPRMAQKWANTRVIHIQLTIAFARSKPLASLLVTVRRMDTDILSSLRPAARTKQYRPISLLKSLDILQKLRK